MRKIYFGLLMLCMVALSCRKESSKQNGPVVSSKPQKVTFSVGFSKTVTNFKTNSLITNSTTPDTSLTNYISVLYYMVFDSAGNSVHNITQLSTDTAFGHYVDNLKPGKYTVAVAGGKSKFMVQPGNLSEAYLFYGVIMGTGPAYWPGPFQQDAFFDKVSITVGNTTANQAFSLNRIVSKLVVNINDTIPPHAENGRLTIGYEANMYFVGDGSTGVFNQQLGSGVNADGNSSNLIEYIIPPAFYDKPNYQMSTLFLYNPNFPLTVDIKVYTTGVLVYGDKAVDNITGAPNKVTLLSGNLFGGNVTNSTGGFQVTINTAWNPTVTRTFP